MKKILNFLLGNFKRLQLYYLHSIKWTREIVLKPCDKNKCAKLKKDYLRKWGGLSRMISSRYFRIFAPFTNYSIDVVPEDVLHHTIEPILNPFKFQPYYEDKNFFAKILKKEYLPQELLRVVDGFWYTADYKKICVENAEDILISQYPTVKKIVLKPSVDSCSGHGVVFFERNGKQFLQLGQNSNVTFEEYVKKQAPDNFIVQECLCQSAFMSQFNPSSINTIRVSVYKSVVTNEADVTAAIMRIGRKNSLVDNAHAGGVFVGVGLDGKIGKVVLNQYGEEFAFFNDIDFSSSDFQIPQFDKVISFAKEIADECIHHRLFALDIMIDDLDEPKLIEYNLSGFSSWLFQFTGVPAFGKYTDEIIDYCVKHRSFQKFVVV